MLQVTKSVLFIPSKYTSYPYDLTTTQMTQPLLRPSRSWQKHGIPPPSLPFPSQRGRTVCSSTLVRHSHIPSRKHQLTHMTTYSSRTPQFVVQTYPGALTPTPHPRQTQQARYAQSLASFHNSRLAQLQTEIRQTTALYQIHLQPVRARSRATICSQNGTMSKHKQSPKHARESVQARLHT